MDQKRLLELAGVPLTEGEVPDPSPTDSIPMPRQVMDSVLEALELAMDTIQRRDEVNDQTIEFTLNALHETLGKIDPHHTFKQ